MGRRKRRSRGAHGGVGQSSQPRQKGHRAKQEHGFYRRAGAWGAGVLAVALAGALGTWLTGLGHNVADNLSRGPSLSAFVDILPGPYDYVLADPVTSTADRVTLLSGTASNGALMSLIARHHGAPVHYLDVTLVLQGHRDGVRVVDIVPQVVTNPGPPPTGAFLAFPSEGTLPNIQVSADMDRSYPLLQSGGAPYFNANEIQLANGESTTFQIAFTATTGFHEFTLMVTYISDGSQEQLAVPGPLDGLFKIAGTAPSYLDYRIVYLGLSANEFAVATLSQDCQLFPRSRGC
jgi:hypothetical protein